MAMQDQCGVTTGRGFGTECQRCLKIDPLGPPWVRLENGYRSSLCCYARKLHYFKCFDGGRTRAQNLGPAD